MPTPPASKQKWQQKIVSANIATITQKPWAAGLLEGVVATHIFFKNSFIQKNRICLIVLDSTLEIAYKEFLVNEKNIGKEAFAKICENRAEIEKKVREHIDVPDEVIKKVNYYYKLRCNLIHQRATPSVTDEEIEDYRSIVEKLLQKMFGINFDF